MIYRLLVILSICSLTRLPLSAGRSKAQTSRLFQGWCGLKPRAVASRPIPRERWDSGALIPWLP